MRLVPEWKNLSFRIKAIVLIEGLVVTVVLVTGVITTLRERETLERELERRGLALAVDLAKFSLRPLLSEDLPTLRRFVNHSMEQDYVQYSMLLDPQGKVVMHSDLAEVGKDYDDLLTMAAIGAEEPGCTRADTSHMEEAYCDIFVPIEISGVRLGTVRLGYSYRALENEMVVAKGQILLIGFSTAVAGGVVAYFLAGFIFLPIRRITDAIRKVANGELDTVVPIERKDELGTLVDSFNKMTQDLLRTTISKNYVDNIIGSMNDTLIVVDPKGKIRSVNSAVCTLLEYTEAELVGKKIDLIISGGGGICSVEILEDLKSGKTIVNREVEYVSRRARQIPMLLSASVLRDKGERIVGVVLLAKDIEDRKCAEEALRESERRLRFLSTQLLTIQEEERRRLSTELHDELGQALVLFRIQLRSVQGKLEPNQAELKGECDELIGYINEVSENVRRLSQDLSPSILEDLGFSAAIRRLAEGFGKQFQVRTSFDTEDAETLFPKEAQIIAYRIIQECYTNVARHSQAKNLSVHIGEREDQLVFRVEDDGIGFDVEEVLGKNSRKKGLGIAAMLERARMLKGTCNITSQPGVGTVVTCTIPLGNWVRRA